MINQETFAMIPHLQHELFIYFRDFIRESRIVLDISWKEFYRYSIIAGIFSFLFYVVLRRSMLHRKIIAQFPAWSEVGREIVLSLMSCVIYALVGLFTFTVIPESWNHYYKHIDTYGWPWFWTSIVLTIFLHDAYFYWTHRLMHHPKVFPIAHRAHHLSHNPSPWTAYSFDPAEAAVQAGIIPLVLVLYPMHPAALIIFMVWQVTYNVFGHCGFEIYPPWFLKSWLGKFLNTPTNHTMHHQYFRDNYGLYFNIWDRMMGTNHARYEERFAEITNRKTPPIPKPEKALSGK